MRGKVLTFFILFIFKINGVLCDCKLNFQDLKNPVYIRDNRFITPDSEGTFTFSRSGTVTIACPGAHGRSNHVAVNKYSTGYDVVEASCIHNQTFRVNRRFANFSDIQCKVRPAISAVKQDSRCLDGGEIYKIGYTINSKLYALYESCYFEDAVRMVFSKHSISPTVYKYTQTNQKRPNFYQGDVFGKLNMYDIYKVANQKKRIDEDLGANMSSKYITKTQSLSRGHLAPRGDFALAATRDASFHYLNAAPQWQRLNSGDWKMLENSIRLRATQLSRALRVWTGTHGELTLADAAGAPRALALRADHNGNHAVPVPLYFYKLVYDEPTKQATAFVSINSPYYSRAALADLVFCSDVCPAGWLKWKTDDGFTSFCCEYDEFVEKVGVIETLEVESLLD